MRRRGGEFSLLGSVGIGAAGVPARRARQIETARAWTSVAGEALARRVRLVELTRGVVWLEAVDRAWLGAIRPRVPELARALARRFPALGVKKVRLRVAGAAPREEAPIEVVIDDGGPGSADGAR